MLSEILNAAIKFWPVLFGAFLSGIISLYVYLRFQSRIQSAEARKSRAMGDVFFLYEATPKIYPANGKKFIELEVKVSNQSLSKLALLAIFVRFKPIINTSKQNNFTYTDFDSLKEFENEEEFEQECSLLQIRNIAFAKGFFWQTSVNGVSVRRGFDIVSDEFCKKYPLVMAQIIIYGASINLIDKTHYPKYQIGRLRTKLCDYLEQKNSEDYNFFSRMGKAGFLNKKSMLFNKIRKTTLFTLLKKVNILNIFEINQGERIVINKDGSTDVENTRKFFPVLSSVINSNIEKVIDLSA
ncbi:MAG: hypothetical protein SGJ10_01150 [Bacteroidota bacterium]|nr:hypothetical protein [Bacteroidota bacterium]